MPTCNILSPSILLETWTSQEWSNLCCWEQPPYTYEAFLTGATEVYNNACLKDRVFSDYITQLYNECFSANTDTFVSGGTLNPVTGVVTFRNTTGGTIDVSGFDGFDSYWSASTGGISNSGLTGNVGIGTTTPNEKLTVSGAISGNSTIAATSYNSTTSVSGYKLNGGKYLWLSSSDLQVGNVVADTDIIGLSINLQTATTINDNLTVTGNTNISGTTSYIGAVSGTGSVTAVGGFVGNLTGTADVASVATTVTLTDESTDTTCFPVFSQTATGNRALETGSNLTFNSNTGILNSTQVHTGTLLVDGTCSIDLNVIKTVGNLTLVTEGEEEAAPFIQISSETKVGSDGTGHDFWWFGDTAHWYMQWDQSADRLNCLSNIHQELGNITFNPPNYALTATTTLTIDNSNTSNGIKIGTNVSGAPISIGHSTSETTVNDNLTVTGDIDVDGTANLDAVDIDGDITMADTKQLFLGSGTVGDPSITFLADTDTGLRLNAAGSMRLVVAGADQLCINNGLFFPLLDNDVDLGLSSGYYFKDLYIKSINCDGDISGATLDISGNADIDGTTNLDAVDIDGAVQIDNTLTIGVDDTGYDVKFFGATAGKYMLWDEDQDSLFFPDNTKIVLGTGSDTEIQQTGSETIIKDASTGNIKLRAGTVTIQNGAASKTMAVFNGANSVDLHYNNSKKLETTNTGIDVTGEVKGDTLDIDGNSQLDGTLTVGVDDTGYDVKFFGDTASAYMLWDTSDDDLVLGGKATLKGNRKYELPSSTVGEYSGGDVYYYGNGSTVKGSIYYIDGTNWTLADADTVAASTGLLAVALGTDPDVDGMLLRGFVTLLTEVEGTEAIGSVLYLSATNTGIATITAPSGSGDIVRVIGYSLHATDNQVYFNPDGTWVQLT